MKKFLSILTAVLMVFSLCACGASSEASSPAERAPAMNVQSAESEEMGFDASMGAELPVPQPEEESADAGKIDPEKIIYTSELTVETTEFDESLGKLMDLVEEYGGYIESSSMNDSDYYSKINGYAGLRSASCTLRIPAESFNEMQGSLKAIGNVPYSNTYTENVSAQYYDTEARLRAYTAQEERLLEMLESAESVDEILAIEGQLTEVRYQIESMQSSLKNMDRRINYSTIYLDLLEVSEYTDSPSPALSYGERLLRSFKDGFRGVGHFFQSLLLWLVGALPAIVVIAVIILILRPVFKRIRAKRKAKKENK